MKKTGSGPQGFLLPTSIMPVNHLQNFGNLTKSELKKQQKLRDSINKKMDEQEAKNQAQRKNEVDAAVRVSLALERMADIQERSERRAEKQWEQLTKLMNALMARTGLLGSKPRR